MDTIEPEGPHLPPAPEAPRALTSEDLRRFVDGMVHFTDAMASSLEPLHRDAAALRKEMQTAREAYAKTDATVRARADRTDRRTGVLMLAGAAFIVATVVGLLVLGLGLVQNRSIAESNREVIMAIQDCTQVGGHCYEENQARSNERLKAFTDALCQATPPERRRPPCTPD